MFLFIDINAANLRICWLRSFGTAGEREIVGCIVNTYLDAYKAEEIKITEEGQTLTTGHAEYAEYLRKFE